VRALLLLEYLSISLESIGIMGPLDRQETHFLYRLIVIIVVVVIEVVVVIVVVVVVVVVVV
jgi:hypothetical protein